MGSGDARITSADAARYYRLRVEVTEAELKVLREFIVRWDAIIVGGDKPERLEGWAREFHDEAARVLEDVQSAPHAGAEEVKRG